MPDPDLEISGGEGGERGGEGGESGGEGGEGGEGGGLPQNFFFSLWASFWSKNKVGPGARFSKVPVTFRARNQIFKSK